MDYTVHRELLHLQIRCPDSTCDFHGDPGEPFSGLPAYVVDEDLIYDARRLSSLRLTSLLGCPGTTIQRHFSAMSMSTANATAGSRGAPPTAIAAGRIARGGAYGHYASRFPPFPAT